MTGDLRVSVVVELDNLFFSEISRAKDMFSQLKSQIGELLAAETSPHFLGPVEVIVLFDPGMLDRATGGQLVSETLGDANIELALVDCKEEYFELKNAGAKHAKGDVVVFLDGDVIPEDGWLVNLLSTFNDKNANVVCGQSYVEPYSAYAKAFALGWIFPIREEDSKVKVCPSFFANNVAFRKETCAEFPFPALEGSARGSCALLSKTLHEKEISIYQNNAARVSHPPPNGLSHFVNRAIAHGRDEVFINRACKMSSVWPLRSIRRTLSRLLSIVRNRRKVNLPVSNVPVALSVMTGYYFLYHASQIMTYAVPGFMTKHFKL